MYNARQFKNHHEFPFAGFQAKPAAYANTQPLHEASSTNPKMICMTQALWSVSSKNPPETIKPFRH
jgi:hypothetical protein